MADIAVLEVQQWLNATYGKVTGFDRVPETGKTGWSTMYALTKALQIELGISSLSNNFGAGTLSALSAHGIVGTGEANVNIGRIVQGGLYAQGYNPYGFDGDLGPSSMQAVHEIKSDMGLITGDGFTPKELKGLLTMNAYSLLQDGTPEARLVQQWMNKTYLHRVDFQIIPCDGLYSRNVQKSLIYAIQYESGMSDSTANGNFGPGTREALRLQENIGLGSVDSNNNFVKLSHAALIFNETQISFNGTFDSSDATETQHFQEFCGLTPTATVTYETWCSLLVSTGDPERPATALDTITPVTNARATVLRNHGYSTVGRYLTNVTGGLNKKIQPGEIQTILENDFTLVPIFQEAGNGLLSFSLESGKSDARKACESALEYGFPRNTTIYFAVDFDPTEDEINNNIVPYFKGVNQEIQRMGALYRSGVYGTRNVCRILENAYLSKNSYVSGMSTGFSGNLGFRLPENWAFDQIKEYSIGTGSESFGIDKVVMSGRDAGVSKVVPSQGSGSNYIFLEFFDRLLALAEAWKQAHPDSVRVASLICHWYRRDIYSSTAWDLLAGKLDNDFILYVKSTLQAEGYDDYDFKARDFLSHREFSNSDSNGLIDARHIFAGVNVYFNRGIPDNAEEVRDADLGGFAGDLVTVLTGYSEYKLATAEGRMSFSEYVQATVIENTSEATGSATFNKFPLKDLIEDVEGYNIANDYLRNGIDFREAVFNAFSFDQDNPTCYQRFLQGRAGNDISKFGLLARSVFMGKLETLEQQLYVGLRTALLKSFTPSVLIGEFSVSERELLADAFCEKYQDLLNE